MTRSARHRLGRRGFLQSIERELMSGELPIPSNSLGCSRRCSRSRSSLTQGVHFYRVERWGSSRAPSGSQTRVAASGGVPGPTGHWIDRHGPPGSDAGSHPKTAAVREERILATLDPCSDATPTPTTPSPPSSPPRRRPGRPVRNAGRDPGLSIPVGACSAFRQRTFDSRPRWLQAIRCPEPPC